MELVYFNFPAYIAAMFIRQVKKKNAKSGKTFFQYQLAQASRIEGKVKQQSILYLGSEPLLSDTENRKMLLDILQAKIFGQSTLFTENYPGFIQELAEKYFEKFRIKYKGVDIQESVSIPPVKDKAQLETIDLNSLVVEDSRTFGGEYLCSQILEKLEFAHCLDTLGFRKKEVQMAHISIISRALFAASEYKTTQYLRDNSELKTMFGFGENEDISHYSLYKIADQLYDSKDLIDKFLYKKLTGLFNIKDSLVIYDLSNTYFEGRKANSKLARYGRSKEKRNDCKQVVFTGVVNAEGFIRYSRIYEGNAPDVSTLEDMINDLKRHSDTLSDKVVVMDAGFASEENLEYLIGQKLKYVCVSRKQIKDYQTDQNAPVCTVKDKRNNTIELQVFTPDGFPDTWMCVKSEQKRIKEQSMADKIFTRFEDELSSLSRGLDKKGTTKKVEKVWERIGRLKEKYRLVSGRYIIDVDGSNGTATRVTWQRKEPEKTSAAKHGMYFIRTNIEKSNEIQLWNVYNTVREVESTFRCLKSDLQLRPVHHQKDQRIESHLYLAILAYQLVNTIRYMLKEKGITSDWRNIVRVMNTQTIQSVVFNNETKKFCVRKPSKPIKEVLDIYQATHTKSMIPDKKKYVVYH
ncbi:MAG: IS1634 family transposase [Bacteroidales bacterium]|nr:IS1634 family transposase [Bacteroidales bacterium]